MEVSKRKVGIYQQSNHKPVVTFLNFIKCFRFSSINKTKGLRQDFAKKTSLRIELKRTKELSKQALEEFKQKEMLKKERRKENLKRTEENKRKSEVVQVITNTKKLKRMRKKQLRFIEKRDIGNIQTNK